LTSEIFIIRKALDELHEIQRSKDWYLSDLEIWLKTYPKLIENALGDLEMRLHKLMHDPHAQTELNTEHEQAIERGEVA